MIAGGDPPPFEALAELLRGVPAETLAAAGGDLLEADSVDPSGADESWADARAVIARLRGVPPEAGEPPALLVFADRIAHALGGRRATAIHRWIDAAGTGEGLSQRTIRTICVVTRRHPAGAPAGAPAATQAGTQAAPDPAAGRFTEDPVDQRNSLYPDELELSAGATMPQRVAPRPPTIADPDSADSERIWGGGIPLRNPDFTGRQPLLLQLHEALAAKSKASVLPQALHGLGGVGKTQLAVEFAYRYADLYDLVWWIPAEQQSLVLQSLYELSRRLGMPATEDLKQAAAMVMDALASTSLRWLLIYDNADDPDDIVRLIPSAGGHVILTSRNQAWAHVWDAIEVDIFRRQESVELIRKRGESISAGDADRLAEKLGDLPLALDQAASWQAATGMPVGEYLALFDQHVSEFLSEGKPTGYRTTVAAFVKLAVDRLRTEAPAVAQLLELFAFLGAEPVSTTLLRRGREAQVTGPLRRALRNPIELSRTVRQLRRYGLAKVDADQRIQVHRLIQLVLREELDEQRFEQSRANVHRLLASANPGEPDDPDTWQAHAEIAPHVLAAGLIGADTDDARRVALDQIRYLWQNGDYEGARRLGEEAVEAWRKTEGQPSLGPDGELTLIATRHLAQVLRSVGVNERARRLDEDTLDRLRRSPEFGPDHEHTLQTARNVGVALRLAGEFAASLRLDEDTVARHQRVFGDEDELTLRARNNLAVSLRMLGDFPAAYRIDADLVQSWRDTVGDNDPRALFVRANLARDLYGLGRYAEALELQQRILPTYRAVIDPRHPYVLLAARTLGVALRKNGAYEAARRQARDSYHDCASRFGPDHEHALAAAMTYANALRACGELGEARALADGAVVRYRHTFGDDHPLTLAAAVNLAIIQRALGEHRAARALDETTYERMRAVLGDAHGYTLCAATGLANDLVLAHRLDEARRLSEATLDMSRRARGDRHPYTLACAVNVALDRQAAGDPDGGQAMLDETVTALRETLGPEHPESIDAGRGKHAECDIEPPPT